MFKRIKNEWKENQYKVLFWILVFVVIISSNIIIYGINSSREINAVIYHYDVIKHR